LSNFVIAEQIVASQNGFCCCEGGGVSFDCCLWTRSKAWNVPANADFVCDKPAVPEIRCKEKATVSNCNFFRTKTLHGEETLLEFVKVITVELRNNPWVKYKYPSEVSTVFQVLKSQ